jgi:hypothetical protein
MALIQAAPCLVLVTAATGRAPRRQVRDLRHADTQRVQARYTRSMSRILTEGFVPVFRARSAHASGITLDLPLRTTPS